MSLEIELAKNTAAVAAMTEALITLRIVLETPAKLVEPIITAEVVEAPKPTMPTDVGTETISYVEVAAAIVSTFKSDRNKTVAALAQFGAKKGPELKPEDYASFLSLLNT